METPQKMRESRNWQITDFEILDFKKIAEVHNDVVRYVCFGTEICPKTHRKHIQAWIQLVNKKTRGGVKRLLGSKVVHLEPMYSTEKDLDRYSKKDGDFQTIGKFICQGQRTDMEAIKKMIDDGATMKDIADVNFMTWCQYSKQFKKYAEMVDREKTKIFRKVKVTVHSGITGTGKTRDAMNQIKYPYLISGDALQWWDGYDGEDTIVIDEYSNDIKITSLLRLLDGYQYRLPTKGGFTYAKWTKVFITTNLEELHPQAKQSHRDALERRITSWKNYRS